MKIAALRTFSVSRVGSISGEVFVPRAVVARRLKSSVQGIKAETLSLDKGVAWVSISRVVITASAVY